MRPARVGHKRCPWPPPPVCLGRSMCVCVCLSVFVILHRVQWWCHLGMVLPTWNQCWLVIVALALAVGHAHHQAGCSLGGAWR